MKHLPELDTPLNIQERLMHAVNLRLNIIIEQNNTIVDGLARLLNEVPQSNVSETIVAEKVAKPKSKAKSSK